MADAPLDFGPDDLDRLARALSAWLRNHPDPDLPVIAFPDGEVGDLTPRNIRDRIEAHARGAPSRASTALLTMYGWAATEEGFDSLLEGLRELAEIGREQGMPL